MQAPGLAERLRDRFAEVLEARGEVTVTVGADQLLRALEHLRTEQDLSFGFLADLTATDWPRADPRFWVAYHVASLEHHHRVRVKVGLSARDPRIPTVTPLYPTANWLEREAFDFFGIVFEGHPDLRRIEMPEGWVGHPLRKDEPLAGVNTRYRGAFIPPPDERGV
ncbi:MAG TPA: NADH-quinone oxidoreductase subunit C [Actinomycetota bacterium]